MYAQRKQRNEAKGCEDGKILKREGKQYVVVADERGN